MEEIVAEGKDRISELPDSIIAHVLSVLSSTKEAIRTSVLSKRWQYLWTWVPVLIIHESKDNNDGFFSSVDRTLACRGHKKLRKFTFSTEKWDWGLDISHVNHWISYAVRCNVEELEICGRYLLPYWPDKLFRNSCLKKLSLNCCNIRDPIGEINLKNLTSFRLTHGHVTRESISKLLYGSPSLEILELAACSGFEGLNITSTGLRKLIVDCSTDEIEIKAPNILSLEIRGYIHSEIMLMDVGSVVEATLNFYTIRKGMLKRMIESLKHVNELKIGLVSLKVLMSLEMENGSSPILRFKYLQINVVKDQKEIECLPSIPCLVLMNECASFFTYPNENEDSQIMWFVLENASVLEKIVIRASPECDPEAKKLRSLLKLRGFILASEEELHIILEKLKRRNHEVIFT